MAGVAGNDTLLHVQTHIASSRKAFAPLVLHTKSYTESLEETNLRQGIPEFH